jgi:hypothetical protein
VAAAWAVWRIASRWPSVVLARKAALYSIGTLASFWVWQRVAVILG